MSEIVGAKFRAAREAASLVEDGMTIGLGSGTTSSLVIQWLGERVRREGLNIVGVASSGVSADLARSVGIRLCEIDALPALDLGLDGADEVDPQFRMIKGRGGALLREKIVASIACKKVIVVVAEKRVESLGAKFPVPVEVSRFGLTHVEGRLRALGASTSLRVGPDGSPFVTDGGNAIIDCRFPSIPEPAELDLRLRRIVGVFETGLFLDLCDLLVVGEPDRVERIEKPPAVGGD